jgi:hypothetical protein
MLSRYVYIAAAVAGLLAIGGAYLKGRSDGDMIAQANARKQIVEQLTERNRINENVSRMSAADLCRQLGGVYVNGECQ